MGTLPGPADQPGRAGDDGNGGGAGGTDVVVVGGGHNGLVCALLLARAGLAVTVVEAAETLGGATRTERPFPRVPELRQSTGSYLLGLMPPELLTRLGLDLPVLRRDPHYVLPTTGEGYLVAGRDGTRTNLFSDADRAADARLQAELAALRDDLAPAWLAPPLTLEATAERYLRPALRQAFVDLCRGSVADYLARFGFDSDLVVAMYVVTDGLSGLAAGPDTPGSGHNFLVHNMCRLPGADGTWQIVRGGMGTVSAALAAAATAAGARLLTGHAVTAVTTEGGTATGVTLDDGRSIAARAVVGACDPFRLAGLAGDAVPPELRSRLATLRRDGSTLKVNLALRDLPELRSLPADAPAPWGATVHLLPEGPDVVDAVRRMWTDVQAGRLPAEPTIEWYVHTTVDPSLQDAAGHHSSALFVQSVPWQPAGSSWERELPGYVEHLLGICDRFAPGTTDLVADVFALPPPGIEAHFGITRGHIHHVDNTVAFADRAPYRWLPGLYAGGAGAHPAGSVIGAAGHNAAQTVLADLGLPTAAGAWG